LTSLAWLALACCAACGNEASVSAPAELDAESTTEKPDRPDAAPVEPGAPAPACSVPEFTDQSATQDFEELRAAVVDDEGNAVAGITAQACGTNLCLFGATDDAGYVLHQRETALRRPAFKYGDGLRYAQFALLLPDRPSHDLGEQITVPLLTSAGGDRIAAGSTVSARGVTLNIADDAEVKLNLLQFSDAADHVFTAREVPRAAWPEAVTAEYGFEHVVALGPLETEFCPPAQLELPNSEGWEPGTAVELLLHVTSVSHHWALFGEWGKLADAEVSEDGALIVTRSDSGIGQLGVIGLRRSDR
jgi:hypothetical protein